MVFDLFMFCRAGPDPNLIAEVVMKRVNLGVASRPTVCVYKDQSFLTAKGKRLSLLC
jgi:hypothetical protein